MNLNKVREIGRKYCGKCKENCDNCKVKDFIRYIAIQIYQANDNDLRGNMPTNVTKSNGKYKQSHVTVFK